MAIGMSSLAAASAPASVEFVSPYQDASGGPRSAAFEANQHLPGLSAWEPPPTPRLWSVRRPSSERMPRHLVVVMLTGVDEDLLVSARSSAAAQPP